MAKQISRKTFIKQISLFSLAFTGFYNMLLAAEKGVNLINGNNSLIAGRDGILKLIKGFKYKIISEKGQLMSDGLTVPDRADGMMAFGNDNGKIILIRNHEIGHFYKLQKLLKLNPLYNYPDFINKHSNEIYDLGSDKQFPCCGGTTTMVYNPKTQRIEKEYTSLAGTLVNCSGGPTPWNTWISCEEIVSDIGEGGLQKNHGYNFEVIPSENIKLNKAIPLKAMGRFRHEAIAIDPITNIAYQTEDRENGLIYRFIPNKSSKYGYKGQLQALRISVKDTRNWEATTIKQHIKYNVSWVDLENPDRKNDDLRYDGENKGATIFARPEGMWYDNDNIYFTCTSGGYNKLGQIWKYQIKKNQLELIFEPNNSDLMKACDNIIVSPWGDLIVCEDGKGVDRLIGIKPNGSTYVIAENILNSSEFAGACFSPDGSILFINIYSPTKTIAITGPWKKLRESI